MWQVRDTSEGTGETKSNNFSSGCGSCFWILVVVSLVFWAWSSYQGRVAEDQYYKDVAVSAEDEAYTNTEKIQELESRVEELERAVEVITNYLN